MKFQVLIWVTPCNNQTWIELLLFPSTSKIWKTLHSWMFHVEVGETLSSDTQEQTFKKYCVYEVAWFKKLTKYYIRITFLGANLVNFHYSFTKQNWFWRQWKVLSCSLILSAWSVDRQFFFRKSLRSSLFSMYFANKRNRNWHFM